jgi:hypothetical protein
METRRDPHARHHWKIQLVKGLYEHGWSANDVRQLFRLIAWLMDLPKELQVSFREELYRYEEDKRMPYVTSIERMAMEKGRQEGRLAIRARGGQLGKILRHPAGQLAGLALAHIEAVSLAEHVHTDVVER